MKLNEFTVLMSPSSFFQRRVNNSLLLYPHNQLLFLVPYENYHVPRYHNWMASDTPESALLRQLTASEPLTLEEEYSLQQSWRDDTNKLTFIVLHGFSWWKNYLLKPHLGPQQWESEAMIGDVNLFLYPDYSSEDENDSSLIGEIELMIAEPQFRGMGFGRQVCECIIHYAFTTMKLPRLVVKINEQNKTSIRLFQSLGFVQTTFNEVFREVELALSKCEYNNEDRQYDVSCSPALFNALVDDSIAARNTARAGCSQPPYETVDATSFRSASFLNYIN